MNILLPMGHSRTDVGHIRPGQAILNERTSLQLMITFTTWDSFILHPIRSLVSDTGPNVLGKRAGQASEPVKTRA
jgi:hypothetical protein